jgi:hypothetical protein
MSDSFLPYRFEDFRFGDLGAGKGFLFRVAHHRGFSLR